jgi:adenosine kinase
VESLVKVAFHALKNKKIFSLNIFAPFIVDFFGDQLEQAMLYADSFLEMKTKLLPTARSTTWAKTSKRSLLLFCFPKKDGSRLVPWSSLSRVSKVQLWFPMERCLSILLIIWQRSFWLIPTVLVMLLSGGFLSQLDDGKDVEACVKAGHFAARYIIQQSGTQLGKNCDYKKRQNTVDVSKVVIR